MGTETTNPAPPGKSLRWFDGEPGARLNRRNIAPFAWRTLELVAREVAPALRPSN